MISIRKEEGYGNDSHCTVLLNGETNIVEDTFNNLAKGRSSNDKFSVIGGINAPIISNTHKYGNKSWYFNGVPDSTVRGLGMISVDSKTKENWNFGIYDFCIEFSMMSISTGNTLTDIMFLRQDDYNFHRIQIGADNTTGKPQARVYWVITIGGVNIVNFIRIMDVSYAPNVWYHIACVRRTERIGKDEEYDHFTIFGNGGASEDIYGISGITNSYISNIPYFSPNLYIGMSQGSTLTNAYIDDFRISKHHYRFKGGGVSKSKRFRVHNRGY